MSTRSALQQASSHLDESIGVRTLDARPRLSPVASTKDVGRRPLRNVGRIDVDSVVPDPRQPREQFSAEAIEQLAASMDRRGQLLPIHVRWDAELEKWVIISGQRRWQAACQAGLRTIDCYFHEGTLTASEILQQQLVENLLREDLTPLEQARAFDSLIRLNGWNGKQVAAALRVPESKVSRALALLRLPDEVQARVQSGQIAPQTAYELSKVRDASTQNKLAQQAARGKLTHAQTARAVRNARAKSNPPRRVTKQTFLVADGWKVVVSANKRGSYHEIQQALEEALEEVRHRIANNVQLF